MDSPPPVSALCNCCRPICLVAAFDPGLSPLGTDDEAAGTPAEPDRIRLARMTGAKGPVPATHTGWHGDPVLVAFIGGLILIGCLIVVGVIWVRS